MMKTKFIFKTLALVMLMPAMLLTTACSSEDDLSAANNTTAETAVRKGYKLPVTVNVTRQGDGTRAAYNESTGKLAFSSGDKLFIKGEHATAGKFAALLTNESEGAFSGNINTEHQWTGSVHELFKSSNSCSGYLLPAGYEGYSFYTYSKANEYDATISTDLSHAFALTKAAAVEQFSEEWGSYSFTEDAGNFVLEPHNAIVCFSISDFQANTNYDIELRYQYVTSDHNVNYGGMNKTVATDNAGIATFAVGVPNETHFTDAFTLTAGTVPVTLATTPTDDLVAGKIYNITRDVGRYLLSATAADIGKLVGRNGRIYTSKAKATAGGTTAVAMIAYVVPDAINPGYSDGLAIALDDEEGEKTWEQAESACRNRTVDNPTGKDPVSYCQWQLPSVVDWQKMFIACGATNGTLNSTPSQDYTISYVPLNNKLTAVGGTALSTSYNYWTLNEDDTQAYYMEVWFATGNARFILGAKNSGNTKARACLVW